MHLDKKGLGHACFPRTAFFGTFQNSVLIIWSDQFFAWFSRPESFSCSICFSFLYRYSPFLAHLCKITLDIPEVYLEPSQLFKMELFPKNSKEFSRDSYISKKLHLRCLTGFLMRLRVLNVQMIIFVRFTCQTNLIQKTSQINCTGSIW